MRNIIMAVLIVVTIMSMVYAFFQQTAAEKSRYEAEANLVLAQSARKEAYMQASLAAEQAKLAANEAMRMQEELAKCKGKK